MVSVLQRVKELRGEHSKEYTIVHDSMLLVWKGLLNAALGVPMDKVRLPPHPHNPPLPLLQKADLSLELTRDDWDRIWSHYEPDKQQPVWMNEYTKFMFFFLDSSGAHPPRRHIRTLQIPAGDKYIDEGEYVEVLKLYDVSESASMKAFGLLCKVRSWVRPTPHSSAHSRSLQGSSEGSKISYGDFVKFWKQYFHDPSPDTPGSYLFGMVH